MTAYASNSPRPRRSGPSAHNHKRRPSVNWRSTPVVGSNRIGMGVQYGDLQLSPRDSYGVKKPSNPPIPSIPSIPIPAIPGVKQSPPPVPSSASSSPRSSDKLRVVVMGGNEEVGRNMTLLEYGNDIILIDMGIQFADEHMRGVDGIVPDLSYLKGREHQVRAVIITHMHMDHIGAIPYLMPKLPGVPLYSAPITLAMIAKKLEYTPDVKVDLRPIDDKTVLHLGNFTATFFGVSHSVPSALAVVIDSPCGKIVHTGDFKVDFNPADEKEKAMLDRLSSLQKENVLALLSDSTNASKIGNQLMERDVAHDLEKIIVGATGRLLFGMISTNVVRLGQIITLAEKHGRRVVVGGKSLKTTLEIAENLGYIKPQPHTLVDIRDLRGLPAHKILAIFPGAQGEGNAAFFKLAHGEIKELHVMPSDTVVFSSSVIPGNERSVQYITDKFYRLGAKVINYRMLNVHAGGHAHADDLGEVVKRVNPKYLIPIEGHHAFLHHHADAAKQIGFPANRIFIADNGQVMEFDSHGHGVLTNKKISVEHVFVDGTTLGTIDADTLRERKLVGDEGLLVVNAVIKGGNLDRVRLSSIGFQKKAFLDATNARIQLFLKREYPRFARTSTKQTVEEKLQQSLAHYIEKETGQKPYLLLQVTSM